MQQATRLPLSLVYPSRSRPVVDSQVVALSESLKVIGLKTPITVRPAVHIAGGRDVDAYDIVTGRHRYEAALKLGWTEIDAYVHDGDGSLDELWEIDENLIRAELTDSQRATAHARREEIMVSLGLVLVGAGKPSNSAKSAELTSYSRKASADLGVSERTVRQDLARGKKIEPGVLADVAGSPLDKGVVLDELAATPREDQRAKLAEITLRRQEALDTRKGVEAVNRDVNRVISLTEAERFAEWLMAHTDLDEVDTLIAWLEASKPKDVIAALRRASA
jgi:ParB family chromosome partitioning protein